jgi:hypothetical protein
MEYARDLAQQMQRDGKGRVLDQFANADNPQAHFDTTGPEIWRDTKGQVTHFVSAMGTTGTITGVSKFLKSQSRDVRIVGAQPTDGSRIPGIRKWPAAYLPKIYDAQNVDEIVEVSQADAEDMARRMASEEGLFAGISAAGACWTSFLSSVTGVTVICRPACFRPESRATHEARPQLLPPLRDSATTHFTGRRWRSEDTPALRRLRLDALEQPDASAGRRDRAGRQGR